MHPVLSRLALGSLILSLAACAATTPGWDASFGQSAREAAAAQTIDRDAGLRPRGPAVTDGKAVAGAQKAYAESYGYAVKEAKPATFTLSPSPR